jgi:hypothetical protein
VEISENSENHLKAIVDGWQVAGKDGVSEFAEKVAEKTQGEEKAAKNLARDWHSTPSSANWAVFAMKPRGKAGWRRGEVVVSLAAM